MATAATVAEEIRRMYYKFAPQQDADLDDRDVLFHVFNGACGFAVNDAQLNAKAEQGYYADDQFYFKYTLPITKDNEGNLYVNLPSAPVAMSGNSAIDHVFFPGSKVPAVFISAKQRSHIGLLPRIPFIQWYRDDMKLYFLQNGMGKYTQSVSFNMICSGADPEAELNLPANYIPTLVQNVFKTLMAEKGLTLDTGDDKVDN